METTTTTARIIHHDHEGFGFVEYEGSFYKGCKRCGGTGNYMFNGEHSRCYTCDNTLSGKLGDFLGTLADAQKWCHGKALRQAAAARKREEARMVEVRKLEAKVQAIREQDAAVVDFLLGVELSDWTYDEQGFPVTENKNFEKSSFIRSMAEHVQFVSMASKPFTPNMLAAVQREVAKRATKAADAAANPVPAGRQVVTGVIVSAKEVEGDYGVAHKILVQDDRGFRIYVSLPKAQAEQAYDTFLEQVEANGDSIYDFGTGVWFLGTEGGEAKGYTGVKGRRITFTATLEASRDDAAFGFGSRPTKGAWL